VLGLDSKPGSAGCAACLPDDAAGLDQPVNDGAGEKLRAQIRRVHISAYLIEPKGATPEMVLNPQLTNCEVSNSSDAAPPANADCGAGVSMDG
jgi:hypothetical protein